MLRSGGGSIVNISSAGAYRGGPVRAAYGTSKAAIVGLTLYVATMYGRQNVRCNAVAPGHMVNPETAARETGDFQAISAFDRLLPDAATPDDVAAVAVFLASDDARAVTGQTYVADGGRLAMKPSYAIELSRSG
jgi:NAD(P)-dependent dehydrogenase (short-subunit alcohol dehydrogenase family)